jgi:hypothetical protein
MSAIGSAEAGKQATSVRDFSGSVVESVALVRTGRQWQGGCGMSQGEQHQNGESLFHHCWLGTVLRIWSRRVGRGRVRSTVKEGAAVYSDENSVKA